MAGRVRHFAIHVDDIDAGMAFYGGVFGWTFEPWGPPGFYEIIGAGLAGALHRRDGPAAVGGLNGFELTIAVEDIQATLAAALSYGGAVAMPPFEIPTVGTLIHLDDGQGNRIGAMKYLAADP